jgi:hypothetical protein
MCYMTRRPCDRCGDLGLLCEAHPLEQFQHDDCDEPGLVCPRCVCPFGVVPFACDERDDTPFRSNVISMRDWQRKRAG